MKNCYDCNNTATHFIAWDAELFSLCSECYDGALQESAARNTLPVLLGAY